MVVSIKNKILFYVENMLEQGRFFAGIFAGINPRYLKYYNNINYKWLTSTPPLQRVAPTLKVI